MRTKPHNHEKERVQEFINDSFVCIGWPHIGSLEGKSKREIKDKLSGVYGYTGHTLGYCIGQVNCFVNTMKKGDIIFITEKNWAHIGVVDDYEYDGFFDNDEYGMCHRRKVNWINKAQISELNASVQRLLRNRNTISQYPETFDASGLEKYMIENTSEVKENTDKLESLFRDALAVLENELKSEDPDRRLKAATELIRLKNK